MTTKPEDAIVAQEQIGTFVDRMNDERGGADGLQDRLTDKLARLHYVLDRMVSRRSEDSVAMTHARRPGSLLLGFQQSALRSHVNTVARRGSVEAALSSLAEWLPYEPWPAPTLNPEWIGHVYVAAAVEFPGIYKVGFSSDVRQRMKDLRYTFKTPMRLVMCTPGTMFDEHLLQHDMRQFAMANEWFDFDGHWSALDRFMRFYTPWRMWSVLHSANVSSAHKSKIEAQ